MCRSDFDEMIVGCDPGKSGALARLDHAGRLVDVADMPAVVAAQHQGGSTKMRATNACQAEDVARRLHTSTRNVHRWRRNGLGASTADRLATHLNMHPAEIWPDWIDTWAGVPA